MRQFSPATSKAIATLVMVAVYLVIAPVMWAHWYVTGEWMARGRLQEDGRP